MRRIVRAALPAAVACIAASAPAGAHLGNISYADFDARGREIALRFKYAAHVTPGLPGGEEVPTTRAQVLALQDDIQQWLAKTATIEAGGKPCALAVENLVGPDSNQDLEVLAYWTCEVDVKGLRMSFHPLAEVMPDWQTLTTLKLGGQTYSTVLSPGATKWTVGDMGPAAPPQQPASSGAPSEKTGQAPVSETGAEAGSTFASFFALGVHHIWTGYDHLLFLFAVLLAGGGLVRLAGIVTSFTVAHSITLGAAATGLVRLPVAPVETVIALSIVYVALENIFERGADRRALVTFGFGLIHGFGFASVLAETALPAGEVLVPLLAFNLGVEAGQLAVVVVVVPILTLLLRGAHARRTNIVLSVLIAAAGAMWAIERVSAMLWS